LQFIIYTSVIYNKAIASNDTNLIANGVIILFIMDIDETVYEFLQNNFPSWVDKVTQGKEEGEPGNIVKKGPKEVKEEEKEEEKAGEKEEGVSLYTDWHGKFFRLEKIIEELQDEVKALKQEKDTPQAQIVKEGLQETDKERGEQEHEKEEDTNLHEFNANYDASQDFLSL